MTIAVGVVVAALLTLECTKSCFAEPVTDWRTYRANAATTLAGQGTNSPIWGALPPDGPTAQASFLLGYLDTPAVLGPNEGDFVRLTFGVAFNDAEEDTQGAGDNFRFALFDLNGEAQDSATGGELGSSNYATAGTDNTDQFRGYWFGNKGGGGAGNNGSIRERHADITGSDNPFTNTAGTDPAPSLGPVGGVNVPIIPDFNGDGSGEDYIGEMTLTRTASGLIDLSGFLKNAATLIGNEFSASDTTGDSLPSNFGAVAFLNGNGMDTDQVLFTDIQVTVGSANQPGDHNGDGIVDAADYVTWRKLDGANQQGYDDFVENFGSGVGGGQATGVPEPAVTSLFMASLLNLSGFARRRRRVVYASAMALRMT